MVSIPHKIVHADAAVMLIWHGDNDPSDREIPKNVSRVRVFVCVCVCVCVYVCVCMCVCDVYCSVVE